MSVDIRPGLRAAAYTAEHGGGTFEAGTLLPFEPSEGYAVGSAPGTAAYVIDAARLGESMRLVAAEWGTAYIGTWMAEDGRVHLDPVTYIVDRDAAYAMARENGQAALYSFADRTVYYVESPDA